MSRTIIILVIMTKEEYDNLKIGDSINFVHNTNKKNIVLFKWYGVKDINEACLSIYDENNSYDTILKDYILENCMVYKDENVNKDKVNHPSYYNSHPSGVECIDIVRHYNFDIGNVIKYLWRAGLKKEKGYSSKEKEIEDCEKALFYLQDHIKQLEKGLNNE